MKKEVPPIAANRRAFLKGAGMTGLGLAGAALIGSKLDANEQTVEAAAYSDTDILNFVLNLNIWRRSSMRCRPMVRRW